MHKTQQETSQRAGRTILVKTNTGMVDNKYFENLVGLQNKAETKTTSSVFLTFDTIANATDAMKVLEQHNNIRVKYSYYRIFFTMSGLTDTSDYNTVKNSLIQHVETSTNSSVLFCKLYRKDTKYLGCGDFTIDTLDGMNKLLAKDSALKQYTLDKLTGSFYRYNTNKVNSNSEL